MSRKVILTIIFFLIETFCYSQTISISSFKLLDTDLTANTAGTMEIDQNGETAALIKVVTTQTGFTFDGGALGIVKTKQTPGEVWVYVPRGSKKISIKHSQLGVLRDYYFPIGIEAAKTYEMILVTGEVQTIVKQTSNSQYLVLKVTPADAVVELDNEILPISDGFAQKFVKLGTYDYRIQAQNYHTAAGKVDIDDPNKKKVIEVTLKPAFGWIEIPANEEFNGAQVFIDNKLEGTIPMKSKDLSSGEHNVKIVKTLYHPFSQTVVIKDNETTKVNPLLSANYSEVTITVENDADIYINEEKKGSGSWSGKLASGSYLLEAKKEGHRSTKQNVDVSSAQPLLNIKLTTPAPIYGEANITSTPTMADIYIDGAWIEKSPLLLSKLLVGTHQIMITKEGYKDYSSTFSIKEGERSSVTVFLEKSDYSRPIIQKDNSIKQKILGFISSQELVSSMPPSNMDNSTSYLNALNETGEEYGFIYIFDNERAPYTYLNPQFNTNLTRYLKGKMGLDEPISLVKTSTESGKYGYYNLSEIISRLNSKGTNDAVKLDKIKVRISKAIKNVLNKYSFSCVFDKGSVPFVNSNDMTDLTSYILRELNIRINTYPMVNKTIENTKFGHVNIQEIIQTMPEYIKIKNENYIEQVDKIQKPELNDLYNDIRKKVLEVVESIGIEWGYSIIVDTGTVPYYNKKLSNDVTNQVIYRLKN